MYQENIIPNLAHSQIRNLNIQWISNNGNRMTPISQQMLTKYRNPRSNQLLIQTKVSFFCSFLGIQSQQNIHFCKCNKTQDGHCELVLKWIQQYYNWKSDNKFHKAYQSYTRRFMEIFISQSELYNRLNKKLEILGIRIDQNVKDILLRLCKNFLKHTIYYGKSELITRESDLWMWFLIGIFYHIGFSTSEKSNSEQEIIFWALDIIMNHLENTTQAFLATQAARSFQLIRQFFPNWLKKIVQDCGIDLLSIINQWTNQMMMGYMGIQSIAFFIDCLLKIGWDYLHKIILSFFQKRMEKIESEQLLINIDKQIITRAILNCSDEWPMIFCNAISFNLERST